MLTIEEAKAIMKAGLGEAELRFVTSLTAPLYWINRTADGKYKARNGSAFFLNAGEGAFGVTAAHVITDFRKDCATGQMVACQLGHDLTIDFKGKNRLIDEHSDIDIATFCITEHEVRLIGKTVLTGHQKIWPPVPPQCDRGIYFAGFPGIERIWLSPTAISFGSASGSGVATSVSERDVSTLIEREHLVGLLGIGLPPDNYDFRGINGGPMLTVVKHNGLRSWRLAGVIYQGPNTDPDEAIASFEVIRARRADFILSNGHLDHRLWTALNIGQRSRAPDVS
jgi:hypothetical protein